jgi:hypothetical protein
MRHLFMLLPGRSVSASANLTTDVVSDCMASAGRPPMVRNACRHVDAESVLPGIRSPFLPRFVQKLVMMVPPSASASALQGTRAFTAKTGLAVDVVVKDFDYIMNMASTSIRRAKSHPCVVHVRDFVWWVKLDSNCTCTNPPIRRYNLSMDVHVFVYDQVHMADLYYLQAIFNPAPLFENKSEVIGRLWSVWDIGLLQRVTPFNGEIAMLERVVYLP